ncbi:hypothetical protein BGW80DRAFT_1557069 [Lactifluus volemus]|nr:hypothetical protein BGW80DRAFT_1557069 [Lactifluus volemus]
MAAAAALAFLHNTVKRKNGRISIPTAITTKTPSDYHGIVETGMRPLHSQPLPAEHPHTLPDATPALLTEAISHVRAELASLKKSEFTFTFFPDSSIAKPELIGCTSAQTNLAIQIVSTLLENGFNPDLPVTPLSTEGWACLCSGLLVSMGRGIIRTDINTLDPNDYQRLKETCVDRSPCNTKPNATLFDRISLLARLLSLAIESPADHDPDIEKAKQDHLRLKKREAILHAEKAALDFQLSETARICSYTECDINRAIRDNNREYFIKGAASLGLHVLDDPDADTPWPASLHTSALGKRSRLGPRPPPRPPPSPPPFPPPPPAASPLLPPSSTTLTTLLTTLISTWTPMTNSHTSLAHPPPPEPQRPIQPQTLPHHPSLPTSHHPAHPQPP